MVATWQNEPTAPKEECATFTMSACTITAMPNAPIAGPMTSGNRGPKRSSNPPDQRDSTAIRTVKGKKEAENLLMQFESALRIFEEDLERLEGKHNGGAGRSASGRA